MEYLTILDSKIDQLLNNDIVNSCILLLFIIYATFNSGPNKVDQPNKLDKIIKIRFDIPIIRILFIIIKNISIWNSLFNRKFF